MLEVALERDEAKAKYESGLPKRPACLLPLSSNDSANNVLSSSRSTSSRSRQRFRGTPGVRNGGYAGLSGAPLSTVWAGPSHNAGNYYGNYYGKYYGDNAGNNALYGAGTNYGNYQAGGGGFFGAGIGLIRKGDKSEVYLYSRMGDLLVSSTHFAHASDLRSCPIDWSCTMSMSSLCMWSQVRRRGFAESGHTSFRAIFRFYHQAGNVGGAGGGFSAKALARQGPIAVYAEGGFRKGALGRKSMPSGSEIVVLLGG